MRRISLLLSPLTALVLATSGTVVSAQGRHQAPEFGVYGGWDQTSLHGPDVPGPLHTNGFLGGAYARWSLDKTFALQPEVEYVQKGNREIDLMGTIQYGMRIRLSYVEVPLLLRASAPVLAGRFTPYVLAGPEVAIKAGCSLRVFGLAGSYTCDDLPPAGSFDYGVIGGAGVDVALGSRHLSLSARYDHGLYDVFKGNDPQNRVVSVVVGVPLR